MPIENRRLTPSNFKPDEPLVSRRYQTIQSIEFVPGDPIHPPMEGRPELPQGIRMRLWMTARAVYAKDHTPTPVMDPAEEARLAVKVEPLAGGWYLITAPWLGEGEKVQGKDAAEARAEEIRDYGDPKGVTVTGKDGGWFEITAAWLAEPEKVQGHDAAEARAAEIRAEGPPEGFDPNVPALLGSDEFEATYNFGGDDIQLGDIIAAAQQASGHDAHAWNGLEQGERDTLIQAELARQSEAAGKPAPGAQPPQNGPGPVGGDGSDQKPVDFTWEDGSNGYYVISGPGLDEPVRVRGREAFDAKLAELRAAAGITPPEKATEE